MKPWSTIVRSLLDEQGLSFSEVSKRTGMSPSAVSNVCNPDRHSGIHNVESVLEAIGYEIVLQEKSDD